MRNNAVFPLKSLLNQFPHMGHSFRHSLQFSSVTQSCPTLWPHESQHARPPCPSPTPGVYSNSCPSSWWCHSAISFSVVPFSSCPQSLPASESFPMSQLFTWGGQSIGVSVSEEESEKVGLKLNIQKTKIMASGPITSWKIDGEPVETVSGFILGGSKITADGDCGHEIKRLLLLGRKVMTNLDSIFKSRDIALPTKVHIVKAMVFPLSCMDVRVGLWRKLSTKELMLLNCAVGEDSWESRGLQRDPTSPS